MKEEIAKVTIEAVEEAVVEERTALDDLVELDVKNAEVEIDVEKYYKEIESFRFQHDDIKKHEADVILEELGPKYIDNNHSAKLNEAREHLYDWFRKYDVDSDLVVKASSEERDKIYGIVQFMKNYYLNTVDNLMFSFEITDKEYKFLRKSLRDEMRYNGVEAFNIIELYSNYISQWDQMYKELGGGFIAPIDIKNVVMLYHFLSKHEVKGLHDDFKLFISILGKIADMNKVFNAFNIVKERINTDFMVWAGAISTDYIDDQEAMAEEQQQPNPLEKIEKNIDNLTNIVTMLAEKDVAKD